MIKKYQKRFLKELAKIDLNSGLPIYNKTKPTHQDIIEWLDEETKRSDFYLNIEQDEIIGGIGIRYEFLDVPDSCEITYLMVKKQKQGIGIGKKLMLWAEDKAKQKGKNKILLMTGTENRNARKFYEHIGYENVGFLKRRFKTSDAIIYRKDFP